MVLLSLFFSHALSLQRAVWEKDHSYFCLDSDPIPPSLAAGLPAQQYTGRLLFWQDESFLLHA